MYGKDQRRSVLYGWYRIYCIFRFPDEIDAVGTKRYDSNSGGEREIQRWAANNVRYTLYPVHAKKMSLIYKIPMMAFLFRWPSELIFRLRSYINAV